MTVPSPQTRGLLRRTWLVGVVGLCALAGCKFRDGETGGGLSKPRDPLVYGPTRIPPQNVPVSDRGGVGTGGPKSDPLKDRTIGGGTDRSGVGYSDGPERFRGTYVPGPATAPAALAARKDGEELKIDTPDSRVPLRQTGGTLPPEAGEASAVATPKLEELYAELARYGVRPDARSLSEENGGFTFRAAVPIGENGARRQYSGVGKTAAEAIRQVLEQLAQDERRGVRPP